MKANKYIIFFIVIIGLVAVGIFFFNKKTQAKDYEHILSFHSDVRIDTTGRVDVTETIKILVTGESIEIGIVRTIPIYRVNVDNFSERIDINIDSIYKDGDIENYSTQVENAQFAIYIGNKDKKLTPKIYTYTIKYWSKGHIGFFDDYDEIYWNVNGNDWAFDIDSISATVHLPIGTKILNNFCYTGIEGSTENNCTSKSLGDSIIEFQSNTVFKKKEGLTVAVGFTPNIIKRPPLTPPIQHLATPVLPSITVYDFLKNDNLNIIFVSILLVMLAILSVSLKRINTKNGRVITILGFNSPFGKSASSLRYLTKQIVDNRAFMSCITSMAIKKSIVIKNTDTNITLTSLRQTSELSEEELNLYKTLFSTNKEISIGRRQSVKKPNTRFEKLKHELIYNSTYINSFIAIGFATFFVLIISANEKTKVLFPFLVIIGIMAGMLIKVLIKVFYLKAYDKNREKSLKILEDAFTKLKSTLMSNNKINDYFLSKRVSVDRFILVSICSLSMWFALSSMFWTAVLLILFSILTLARKSYLGLCVIVFVIINFSVGADSSYRLFYIYSIVLFCILIILNIIFSLRVNPMTKEGVQFSSELKGFKRYLSIAEEDLINFLTPPEMTPELFEKMLPYAIALDLEVKWAEKFEKLLSSSNYRPTWYEGVNSNSYTNFTTIMSDSLGPTIKSSISESINRTSSDNSGNRRWHSGSRGGGSSGGGGGGGGGRGW